MLVAGLAMAVGGMALVAVLRASLTRELRTAARLRGQDVADLLAADAAGRGPLTVNEADELLTQVLDERGRVVVVSPNAKGDGAAGPAPPRPGGRGRAPGGGAGRGGRPVLAVAVGADTALGRRTAHGAGGPVHRGRHRDHRRRRRAAPAAGDGGGDHLGGGRPGPGPVEAIRAEVDAISAAALHRRVQALPADDEIGRLAWTMNRMVGRLEQAQARQRRLVSDASHELRSPVAAIRQHAEVALAHPTPTTTVELAATTGAAASAWPSWPSWPGPTGARSRSLPAPERARVEVTCPADLGD